MKDAYVFDNDGYGRQSLHLPKNDEYIHIHEGILHLHNTSFLQMSFAHLHPVRMSACLGCSPSGALHRLLLKSASLPSWILIQFSSSLFTIYIMQVSCQVTKSDKTLENIEI